MNTKQIRESIELADKSKANIPDQQLKLVSIAYLLSFAVFIFLIISILMIGNKVHETVKDVATIDTKYTASINGIKTVIEKQKDGTEILPVGYEKCYKVAWTDEEICKREIIRVVIRD